MAKNTIDTIKLFVRDHRLLDGCGKVLVAVSGGVDSMVLLHILAQMQQPNIVAVHINHNLRGSQSDADEQLVTETANTLGIELYSDSVNVQAYVREKGLSIETAARMLRQTAFREFLLSSGCDVVATGHHADDNAETIIHRLLRGTGYRGLAGINPKRTINGITFISPMLCVTRKEILRYAKHHKIKWRHDHTNDDCAFTRNKIRHKLLPYIQRQCKTDITRQLTKLADMCVKLNTKVENHVNNLALSGNSLEIDVLKSQPEIVQVEMIRRVLVQVGCGLRSITEEHYNKIIGLGFAPGRKRLELPGGFIAERISTKITFFRCENSNQKCGNVQKSVNICVKSDGFYRYANFGIKTRLFGKNGRNLGHFVENKDEFVEWFDADKIIGDLIVRTRQQGDTFSPIGSNSTKKVGKFITDTQAEYHKRDNVIIFEDGEKIIWVCPLRASEQTKVCDKTTKILEIRISET